MDELSPQEIELLIKQINALEQDLGNAGSNSIYRSGHDRITLAISGDKIEAAYEVISDILKTSENMRSNYPNLREYFAENNSLPDRTRNSFPNNPNADVSRQNINDLFVFVIDVANKDKVAEFNFKFAFNQFDSNSIENGEQQFENLAGLITDGKITNLELPIRGTADVKYKATDVQLAATHDFVQKLDSQTSYNQLKTELGNYFGDSFLQDDNAQTGLDLSEDEQVTQFLASTVFAVRRSHSIMAELQAEIEEDMANGLSLSTQEIEELNAFKAKLDERVTNLGDVLENVESKSYAVSTQAEKEQLWQDYQILAQNDVIDEYTNVIPRLAGADGVSRPTPDLTVTFGSNDKGDFEIENGMDIRVMGKSRTSVRSEADFQEWRVTGAVKNKENFRTTVYAENNGYTQAANDNSKTYISTTEEVREAIEQYKNIAPILQGEQNTDVTQQLNNDSLPTFDPSIDVDKGDKTENILAQLLNEQEAERQRSAAATEALTGSKPNPIAPSAKEELEEYTKRPDEDRVDVEQYDAEKERLGLHPKEYKRGLEGRITLSFRDTDLQPNLVPPLADGALSFALLTTAIGAPLVIGELALKTAANLYEVGKTGVEAVTQELFGAKLPKRDKEQIDKLVPYIIIEAIELDKDGVELKFNTDKFKITSMVIGSNNEYKPNVGQNRAERNEEKHLEEVSKKQENINKYIVKSVEERITDLEYLSVLRDEIEGKSFAEAFGGDEQAAADYRQNVLDKIDALIAINDKSRSQSEAIKGVEAILLPLEQDLNANQDALGLPRHRGMRGSSSINYTYNEALAREVVTADIQEDLGDIYNYIYRKLDTANITNPNEGELPRRIRLGDNITQEQKQAAAAELLTEFIIDNNLEIPLKNDGSINVEVLEAKGYEELIEIRKQVFDDIYNRELTNNIELKQDISREIFEIFVAGTNGEYDTLNNQANEQVQAKETQRQKDAQDTINNRYTERFQPRYNSFSQDFQVRQLLNKDRRYEVTEQDRESVLDFLIELTEQEFGAKGLTISFESESSRDIENIRLNVPSEIEDDVKAFFNDLIIMGKINKTQQDLEYFDIEGAGTAKEFLIEKFQRFQNRGSSGYNLSPDDLQYLTETLAGMDISIGQSSLSNKGLYNQAAQQIELV